MCGIVGFTGKQQAAPSQEQCKEWVDLRKRMCLFAEVIAKEDCYYRIQKV